MSTQRLEVGTKVRLNPSCKKSVISDLHSDWLQEVNEGALSYEQLGKMLRLLHSDSELVITELDKSECYYELGFSADADLPLFCLDVEEVITA